MPRTLRDGTRLDAPQRENRTRALRSGPRDYNAAPPGVCPSGQRERAVNPSAQPTEVRILPPPLSLLVGAVLQWKWRFTPARISGQRIVATRAEMTCLMLLRCDQ